MRREIRRGAPWRLRILSALGIRVPAARYRGVMAEPVDAYEAFCNGQWLLEVREYRQAVIALERAKALEPDKASIREALGRAYLASRAYRRAADEFGVAVELQPDRRLRPLRPGALPLAPGRPPGPPPLPAGQVLRDGAGLAPDQPGGGRNSVPSGTSKPIRTMLS